MSEIVLGAEYEDKVTGFKGVATGYVQYLTGCNQALLTPKADPVSNKMGDAAWFDVQRLDRLGVSRLTLENGLTPGCDMAAPIR